MTINGVLDRVAIRDNKLVFIELKRIGDNRMLDKIGNTPEIIRQMDKYSRFIKTNNRILSLTAKIVKIRARFSSL